MEEQEKPEALIGRLKTLIDEKGITHREVSIELGIYESTLSRWMNGKHLPDSEIMISAIERYIKKKS